jgi:alkyldihydroxyacetonephosphate synthase
MPYLRDTLIRCGILNDTFETAITWDRLGDLREAVRAAVPGATCRFTHVYPDGPAPYFTVVAPARRGSELEQWDEIKAAASEAVISAGGTITHHHAVGRDHRPWYDRQRPEAFAHALRAAKTALDPEWILNPGTVFSRERR